MVVLALGGLADILYLDIREQAASYASLQAAGLRDRTVTELIVFQAVLMGAIGAVLGVAAGLGVLGSISSVNRSVLLSAISAGLLAVALSAVVALLPACSLRRLPTAVLLSRE